MSKKILIIEDEESIADLEKDYLELSDFEVAVANDGEIGRRKALEEDYDLIILNPFSYFTNKKDSSYCSNKKKVDNSHNYSYTL